ncbi:MAG: glycosyltransferase [Candidatus Tumulicola sp.]
MGQPSAYGELVARLSDEQDRLETLRADYERITASRFHALRVLWFSLKGVLGISSPDDVYAVWSPRFGPRAVATRSRGAMLREAETLLIEAWNQRAAERAMADPPAVSVVIPVYNHRDVTTRCLRSIADSWFESLDVQFIVVDDGSFDGTCDIVTSLAGLDYVRSGKNEGFIRACNRGAAIARGRYLCFLNNDTVVRGGWLEYLVKTAEGDPKIGVVGAKLVYPDGRLQEAGNIIWRDATGWNVGHAENAEDPRYNFVRDADYVSGSALLIRRELFERLGGFSEAYRPAYYEDADLCFGVRSLGYRVVYQPRAEVVHYEGLTSGDERAGVKRFQEVNRPRFREKWSAELGGRLENSHANVVPAWRRGSPGKTMLIVDSYVPLYDHEAGSQRMQHIIVMLRDAGYRIVFLPDNYAPLQPYTDELQQLGVEVLHHIDGGKTLQDALDEVVPLIDAAWISRPHLYQKYAPLVRADGRVRMIYDTVDLSHVRKRRQAELLGEDETSWREALQLELECARSADVTVVVTPDERRVLEELGLHNVYVIPTIHEIAIDSPRRFEETSGLLFIANYNHPPNVDAVTWLCEQIMPMVWEQIPDVTLTLVGSNPSQAVLALKSQRVRVTGYVRDVTPLFSRSRLFVAPLRFGAGMKGKIGHALSYALPIVTTPVGAEGIGLRNGENSVIVEPDAHDFAAAILSLYGDADRWRHISEAAVATLRPFTPGVVAKQLHELLERVSSLQPV